MGSRRCLSRSAARNRMAPRTGARGRPAGTPRPPRRPPARRPRRSRWEHGQTDERGGSRSRRVAWSEAVNRLAADQVAGHQGRDLHRPPSPREYYYGTTAVRRSGVGACRRRRAVAVVVGERAMWQTPVSGVPSDAGVLLARPGRGVREAWRSSAERTACRSFGLGMPRVADQNEARVALRRGARRRRTRASGGVAVGRRRVEGVDQGHKRSFRWDEPMHAARGEKRRAGPRPARRDAKGCAFS